jgi:non-ribosomal peptide synthetase component F
MTAMNLASMLSRTAERSGDRPAVRLGEATMTYRELDETSARSPACWATAASSRATGSG